MVVALSQEDRSLQDFAKMPARFESLRFPVVADLQRRETAAYDRTTAYLIDKEGVVREIFPMIIHARPSWRIVLGEVEKLERAAGKAAEAGSR